MASIDLSAAFDLVNVDLLITRLTVIGLPSDVIRLIKLWLKTLKHLTLSKMHFTSNFPHK